MLRHRPPLLPSTQLLFRTALSTSNFYLHQQPASDVPNVSSRSPANIECQSIGAIPSVRMVAATPAASPKSPNSHVSIHTRALWMKFTAVLHPLLFIFLPSFLSFFSTISPILLFRTADSPHIYNLSATFYKIIDRSYKTPPTKLTSASQNKFLTPDNSLTVQNLTWRISPNHPHLVILNHISTKHLLLSLKS